MTKRTDTLILGAYRTLNIITRSDFFSLYAQNQIKLKDISLFLMKCGEYSCAMKSHFRKSGNQMSGKWKSSYASLLA